MPQPCFANTSTISTIIGHTGLWARPLPYALGTLPHRTTEIHNVQRRNRVGGLIHEYQQVA